MGKRFTAIGAGAKSAKERCGFVAVPVTLEKLCFILRFRTGGKEIMRDWWLLPVMVLFLAAAVAAPILHIAKAVGWIN